MSGHTGERDDGMPVDAGEAHALPGAFADAVVQSTSKPRVLVIDDEAAIRNFVTRALDPADARGVESGSEALQVLENGFDPELIICDLMMPSMTGRDVYAEISRRWPGLQARMVFATGGTFTDDMTQFLESVDNRVLDKPFRLATLRSLLESKVA